MNILFVCSAKSWGGNEKWTSMALDVLKKKHRVFFIGKSESLLNKFGNTQSSITLHFHSYFDWFTFRQLKEFIRNYHIDLIISTKKKEYFMCGIISRQLGIKHIIRLGANRKMNIPVWHKLNYKILNDGLIVNSDFIAENLRSYSFFNTHPIHVLKNGIPGFNSKSTIPERPLANDRFVIVSSGRITKLKGYHLLIEAIAQLEEKFQKHIEVRIIGEGRNKEEFINLSKKFNLENIVHFTGFSDNPTQLMSDAHLFVLLSEREGLSNSILEAMTMGIPVLSTDTGGIKELITDSESGFLVERTVEAISHKLKQLLLSKELLVKVGYNGFQKVREKFSYDIYSNHLLKLIDRISSS